MLFLEYNCTSLLLERVFPAVPLGELCLLCAGAHAGLLSSRTASLKDGGAALGEGAPCPS